MKVFRGIAWLVAVGLVGAGIASWRLEFDLPVLVDWQYLLVGAGLVFALLYGKILGHFCLLASPLPILVIGAILLFDKSSTWDSVDGKESLYWSGVLLAVGIALRFLGSEGVAENVARRLRAEQRPVVCKACDQTLGVANNFTSPCPRCGSNRYKYDD